MDYLQKFRNELVEIYEDDEDRFLLGYIVSEDEEAILLKNISVDGLYDGCALITKSAIENIEFKTPYIEKMLEIMEENKKNILGSSFFKQSDIILPKDNLFESIYQIAFSQNFPCKFESCFVEGDISAKILKIYDDYLLLKNDEGESLVKKDEFYKVFIDRMEERKLFFKRG